MLKVILWFTVVEPRVVCLEGEENFYVWSKMVVPMKAHSPMAKEASSNDLQWW